MFPVATFLLGASWTASLLNLGLILVSLFLILLVLIQRGKGGGLAGAFGAVGGSSAFGSRAGDKFTRITLYVAGFWLALAVGMVWAVQRDVVQEIPGVPGTEEVAPAGPADDSSKQFGK